MQRAENAPHLAGEPLVAIPASIPSPWLAVLSASGVARVVALLAILSAGCAPGDGRAATTDRALGEAYTVERIADGDTVVLTDARGREEKVRVQGIDTPETHASSKLARDVARAQGQRSALDRETIRALGASASAHAARLLPSGAAVRVVSDGRDRYGRLVGTIEATDDFGQPFDFGARMIADGYAHAYDGGGRYPRERMGYYLALQREARASGAGLWADGLDALDP